MKIISLILLLQAGQMVAPQIGVDYIMADISAGGMMHYRFTQSPDAVLAELSSKRDFRMLYHLLREERVGNGTPFPTWTKVRDEIGKLPGHAIYLGDIVEDLTEKRDHFTYVARGYALGLLETMATPEAVQQLDRFVFDDREYENALMPTVYHHYGPNSLPATRGIYKILEKQGRAPYKLRTPGFFGFEESTQMQQWWRSESSLAFRREMGVASAQPAAKAEVSRPVAPIKPKKADPTPKQIAEEKPPASDHSPYLWLLLVLGTGLAVWFATRRARLER